MGDYDILLNEIKETAAKVEELRGLAYEQYSQAVEGVLADQITEEKQIEELLDGIMDFCDEQRFIKLTRKLCRHIYSQYPQLVGDYVNFFRILFEEDDEGA